MGQSIQKEALWDDEFSLYKLLCKKSERLRIISQLNPHLLSIIDRALCLNTKIGMIRKGVIFDIIKATKNKTGKEKWFRKFPSHSPPWVSKLQIDHTFHLVNLTRFRNIIKGRLIDLRDIYSSPSRYFKYIIKWINNKRPHNIFYTPFFITENNIINLTFSFIYHGERNVHNINFLQICKIASRKENIWVSFNMGGYSTINRNLDNFSCNFPYYLRFSIRRRNQIIFKNKEEIHKIVFAAISPFLSKYLSRMSLYFM